MRGIVVIAIGKEYAKIAAATIKYSQQFTDLPFFAVASENIPGTTTYSVPDNQKNNRAYKLTMPEYVPFDQVLYMDADSVIQREGVETVYDLLSGDNIVLNRLTTFFPDRIPNIYIRAMKETGAEPPLPVYNGGLICFDRSSKDFFGRWKSTWEMLGSGREMPALNCSLSGVKITEIPEGFYAPGSKNPEAVIQHDYGMEVFCKQFNFPTWAPFKPFDSADTVNDFRTGAWG